MIQKQQRTTWIDVAKAMAIVAVMVDHTFLVLYQNPSIAYASFFSVSLFVLMTGITTYWSMEKNSANMGKKLVMRIWSIYGPYLLATAAYVVVFTGSFDLATYIDLAIHFKGAGILYYVFLYIQLMVISPVVYQIFRIKVGKWQALLIEATGLLVVAVISAFTTKYTNIMYIYGGGGKLFGGTYLILFYLGMWFAKYYTKFRWTKISAGITVMLGMLASAGCGWFITVNKFDFDSHFPFGQGLNPPSVSLIAYSIFLASTIYAVGMLLDKLNNDFLTKVFDTVALLGRNTLYIFLYHLLFMELLNRFFASSIGAQFDILNLKRVLYFVVMISGSLLIQFVLGKVWKGTKILIGNLKKNRELRFEDKE